MGTVHTLVAEVFAQFIYTVETTYDQLLEVEFRCDTQVEINIQRVVVCDKRTCRCAARNRLQNRGLNLQIASLVEELAHGADDLAALDEDILHLRIDDQIHIALTITQFWVAECIVNLTVFLLDDWQWTQRFAQECELFAVDRQFAGFGQENETFDSDDIADIEQFFEHFVVEGGFGVVTADVVAFDIDLNLTGVVLQFEK